jgi:hypothetical protein
LGKKARKEREEKRESFAAKRSSEKRSTNLKAIGVLAIIAVIGGYAAFEFVTMEGNAMGAPTNAGRLGDEHEHASLLVKIFGDNFDFGTPNYQIKTSWIHFEDQDGKTIHRHSTGVELEYLFNSLNIGLSDRCFIFPDGRQFCTNDDYSLKYFINHDEVDDIRKYVIAEDDRILISYGNESQEDIDKQLAELDAQMINKK